MSHVFSKENAKQARETLRPLLNEWMTGFLAVEGFYDWKNKQIISNLFAVFNEETDLDQGDFPMPDAKAREHKIVSGFLDLERACLDVQMCEYYFRRYPFSGLPVSKEDHLRNCCELYLSKIGQFRYRFVRQIKWLARLKKNTVPVDAILSAFNANFGGLIEERNAVHHEKSYDDVHLSSVALANLLSLADTAFPVKGIARMAYRRNVKGWVRRVRQATEYLELYLGITALFMVECCSFLRPSTNQGCSQK